MKNFFPLKFLVILYSILFLAPLVFIIRLPNSPVFIAIKILFGIWMICTFLRASKLYSYINLGAFLFFVGFTWLLRWFFYQFPFNYLLLFLFICWYGAKFSQINALYKKGELSLGEWPLVGHPDSYSTGEPWSFALPIVIWGIISILITAPLKGVLFVVGSGIIFFIGKVVFTAIVAVIIRTLAPEKLVKNKNVVPVITMIISALFTLLPLLLIFFLARFIDQMLLIPFGVSSIAWIIMVVENYKPIDK
ncbi:MAG: hypothetical protein PHH68_07970 [Candidatus Omnitrophica bacterium]|nr:hypothetical protein [Candidatus Omnitrophota bacterium]